MKSIHGGSPPSGLAPPIGLDALQPATPEGMVLVPQEVVDARAQAEKRAARALELERRRIALELLGGGKSSADPLNAPRNVEMALTVADELINQTGGGI